MPLPKLGVFEKTELDIRRSINRLEIHRLNNPDDAEVVRPIIKNLTSANEYLQDALKTRKETV